MKCKPEIIKIEPRYGGYDDKVGPILAVVLGILLEMLFLMKLFVR